MSDIDLIPTDYRNRIWFQGKTKLLGASIVFMLVITAAIYISMQLSMGKLQSRISGLHKHQEATSEQHEVITQLNENIQNSEYRLLLLDNLRGGPGVLEMFTAIDRAINDADVWFDNWDFQCASSPVEHIEQSAKNGNLIILPAGNVASPDTAWIIETHMTIKGQAKDHSALSRFVRRLYNQPVIHDVKILNTATAAGMNVVDFNMAVTVKNYGANS